MSARGLPIDDAAWESHWRPRQVRDKAVLSFGLLGCALTLPPWPGGVVAGVTTLTVLLSAARVPVGLLFRSLLPPLVFIVLGAVSVLVSLSWDGGVRLGVGQAGAATAATVVVRGLAGTLAVFVLAATTPMVDIVGALRRARIPDPLVDIAGLTYRLLFVLLDSARTIVEAQASRLGYADRRSTMRSSAGLLVAILERSWSRAQRLEEGLAGRGYSDNMRTLDPPLVGSWRFCALSVGLVAVIALGSAALSGLLR